MLDSNVLIYSISFALIVMVVCTFILVIRLLYHLEKSQKNAHAQAATYTHSLERFAEKAINRTDHSAERIAEKTAESSTPVESIRVPISDEQFLAGMDGGEEHKGAAKEFSMGR